MFFSVHEQRDIKGVAEGWVVRVMFGYEVVDRAGAIVNTAILVVLPTEPLQELAQSTNRGIAVRVDIITRHKPHPDEFSQHETRSDSQDRHEGWRVRPTELKLAAGPGRKHVSWSKPTIESINRQERVGIGTEVASNGNYTDEMPKPIEITNAVCVVPIDVSFHCSQPLAWTIYRIGESR
jgi:hypothetical protein